VAIIKVIVTQSCCAVTIMTATRQQYSGVDDGYDGVNEMCPIIYVYIIDMYILCRYIYIIQTSREIT